MAFVAMTKEEISALDALHQARQTLARAELLKTRADVNLYFVDLTKSKMDADPWFAEQGMSVQSALRGALGQTEAEARLKMAEAALMIESAPRQIAAAMERAGLVKKGDAGV